jgi:hypothetical protein
MLRDESFKRLSVAGTALVCLQRLESSDIPFQVSAFRVWPVERCIFPALLGRAVWTGYCMLDIVNI